MASRYLRASGNWNGPVWAATSGGTAGSAATPTTDDYVYMDSNFTVTLSDDAECTVLYHDNGEFNLSQYTLTAKFGFLSSGSTSRSINLGSGTIKITSGIFNNCFRLRGENLNFDAGASLIDISYQTNANMYFDTLNNEFNDVIFRLGYQYGSPTIYGTNVSITGSPTFRSLIIQSKNSAAHTVNFDSDSYIETDKLVLIGSSSSSKLTVDGGASSTGIAFADNGTSYGQYVNLINVYHGSGTFDKPYIGSNSTHDNPGSAGTEWLLQDPPKISTLVDPLTTAPGSNSNWTVNGTITQITTGHEGGGYTGSGILVSTDTYDLVDSEVVFELYDTGVTAELPVLGNINATHNVFAEAAIKTLPPTFEEKFYASIKGYKTNQQQEELPNTVRYAKMSITSGVLKLETSIDGESWSLAESLTLVVDEIPLWHSTRINALGGGSLGSVNPQLSLGNTGAFLQFF